MDSTTVQTWSQFGQDKINEFIGAIKTIAPEAWRIVVKQMVIDATVTLWQYAIFWTITIIVLSISLPLAARGLKKDGGDSFRLSYAFAIVFGAAAFIGVICTVSDIPYAIKQLNNPEYYALKQIMQWR